MNFTAVLEIWTDDKVVMLVIEIGGHYLPEQLDMTVRDEVVEAVQYGYPEYKVLDLVAVIYKGEIQWSEM